MIAIIATALFILSLVYLNRQTGPYVFFAIVFILFGFILRMCSALYVGLFGPIFSVNFGRYLQDESLSSLVFSLSFIVVIVTAAWVLKPSRILRDQILMRPIYGPDKLGQLALGGFVLLTVLLYGDMLIRGVIPLFSLMERNVYTDEYAGIFHKGFLQFFFVLSFMMGFFAVRPRLMGGGFELRYLTIFVALIFYFLLTGHRFSIFFSMTSFFIMPIAAIWLQARAGRLPPSSDPLQVRRVMLAAKAAAPIIFLLLALISSWALYNSIYNVRGYGDPVQAFIQRSLVQPTEFWWATWSSSILNGGLDTAGAFDFMFVHPLDDSRNTGIQLLMARELGSARAAELLNAGEQFAGGYPEVLFELMGPLWVWPAMFLFAGVTLGFLSLALSAVCSQRLGTAFFAVFLFYGFSILYIGGMLNFLLAPTLYIKLAGLAFFYFYERRQGPMLPRMAQR